MTGPGIHQTAHPLGFLPAHDVHFPHCVNLWLCLNEFIGFIGRYSFLKVHRLFLHITWTASLRQLFELAV